MNRFEFLKNYKEFAAYVRYRTANVLFNRLKTSQDSIEKRSLMLRIIEELAASTEDLTMWLIATKGRNDGDKRFNDEWERLLTIRINEDNPKNPTNPKQVLSDFMRLRTTTGFLRKLNFPTLEHITRELDSEKALVRDAIEKVRSSIEMAIKQRAEKGELLLKVQNKVKHGMMVCADPDPNLSWIRIFAVKPVGKKQRISRKTPAVVIPIDIDKAERMVGTIKAYGQAIEALINLLLIDYKYRIVTGKIRMRKITKDKCLESINNGLS